MREKIFFSVLLCAVIICCVSGCRPEEEEDDRAAADITLEVWAWDNTFNVKAANIAAEIYRKNHPDIEIQVVSKEKNEIMQTLVNDFSAEMYEKLPDVVLIEDYEIQKLLHDYPNEFRGLGYANDYDNFLEYKTKLASREGIRYGVPFDSGAAVMFYRLDYINAAGYDEEDMENLTWDEYIEIGRRVKQETGVEMLTVQPDDLGLIRIMMQSASSWYMTQDGETVNIKGNKALREAISIYRDLVGNDLALPVNGWEGFAAAFQQGKVATVVSGCWIASTIQQRQDQAGLWRAAQIPRMEGVPGAVNASNIGGCSWYVLKNKEHSEEAARFLEETFGEDKEFINQLAGEIELVSTRKDAEELPAYETGDPYFGGTNVLKVFLENTRQVPYVNYGSNTYQIEAVLAEELQSILKGEDLDQGLEKVHIKAQSIVG